MTNKNVKYFVWGEQNGEVEVPVINLWKTKQGIYVADNLGGALAHGTEVEVLSKDNDGWYKISADVEHEGETYHQEGYVKNSLIKREYHGA